MDKKLELRVIETGYNPKEAEEITEGERFEEIIMDMYSKPRKRVHGTILFDGKAHLATQGQNSLSLSRSFLGITRGKEYDGEKHVKGLYIYSLADREIKFFISENENNSFSFYALQLDGMVHEAILDISMKNGEKDSGDNTIKLYASSGTRISYLPKLDEVEQSRFFWEHIAKVSDLKLEEIENEDKYDKRPYFKASREGYGLSFIFKSRHSSNSIFVVKTDYQDFKIPVDALHYIINDVEAESDRTPSDPHYKDMELQSYLEAKAKVTCSEIDFWRGDLAGERIINYIRKVLEYESACTDD